MPESSKVNPEWHRIHVGNVVLNSFHFEQVKAGFEPEPTIAAVSPLKHKVFPHYNPFMPKCPASKSSFIYVAQDQKSHLASGGFTIHTVYNTVALL